MKALKNNLTAAYVRTATATAAIRRRLSSRRGDFVVNHAVVFVIIIVLGAAALLLLRNFLNSDLAPLLTSKLKEFFN